MPFTPFHMGPGLFLKAVFQSGFSLMVFGWTQIIMDVQPLIVLLTEEGHLHGFSHTYIGASLIALFSALTGKYLSEFGLKFLRIANDADFKIGWFVCIASAFLGSFSHVLLDSIMHSDVEPFYPISLANEFHGIISVAMLHKLCLYSGLVGIVLFSSVLLLKRKA